MPEINIEAETPAAAPELAERSAPDVVEAATVVAEAAVTEPREAIESPEDRLIDTLTASQQDAIDSVETASSAVAEGIGLAHRAFADFIAERVRQDLATQRALIGSRSIEEARSISFAHLRTTVDQYGREVSRMMRLGTVVAQRSLERPRPTIRKA